MTKIRYIDTTDLPKGFDAGDLIASGVTGPALIDWLKARVRDGLPPAEARPETVRKPEPAPAAAQNKSPSTEGVDAGAGGARIGESQRKVNIPVAEPPSTPVVVQTGNVVTLERAKSPEPEIDPDLPPEFSDDALAERFADRYSEVMAFVPTWGRWMEWNNAVWEHDERLRALHLSRCICREASNEALLRKDLASKARTIATGLASARTMGNVERVARSDPRVVATSSQWDRDEWALNTPGGLVDLRTGSIRQTRRSDYVTKITSVAPGGDCPTWLEFLRVATDGDDQLIEFMRRMAGYCLTGSTREHAIFFVYGTGGNGKGTFLNTLSSILNTYKQVASMEMFVEQKFQGHSTDLAGLMGARMVLAQETQAGKKWNDTRLKAMSGGDDITARFMRNDNFTYTPQFKLVFAGNHKPQLHDVDEAIRRRFHLIPFTVTIPPERRDRTLMARLQEEAGGILQWAIDGCLDWQDNMLAPPQRVLQATEEYFEEEDTIGQFLSECVEFDSSCRVNSTDLYKRYCRWTEDNREYTLKRKLWRAAMASRGMESYPSGGKYWFDGMRLKYEVGAAGASDEIPGF